MGNLHFCTPSVTFLPDTNSPHTFYVMNPALPTHAQWRSPRARLIERTPAVLRMADGQRSRGVLETISLTGGMLNMPTVLNRGSQIKLMFLTQTGPVAGSAEMLRPVSETHQPFRFVALEDGDQRRLHSVLQTLMVPVEQAWIEKYRAAVANCKPERRGTIRILFGVLSISLCLASVLYLLNSHFLR